jgi:hypothetical protein
VVASLYFSIAYSDAERSYTGMAPSLSTADEAAPLVMAAPPREALKLERLRLRQEIEFLNGPPPYSAPV